MYPLFFSTREAVSGKGFLGGVVVRGRVLMVQEEDGSWWLYGVEPGGMAASGGTPQEVYANFIRAFKSILFDIATDCADFPKFKQAVQGFFGAVDSNDEARWLTARGAIRAGHPIEHAYVSSLPKVTRALETEITVERLDRRARSKSFTPKDNKLDQFQTAA